MQRQLLQIPFVLTAALALGTVIATCFGIEIFISEIYNGPFKSMLVSSWEKLKSLLGTWLIIAQVYLPTILITTFQPVVLGVLTEIATRLTNYENYETEGEYEAAMTQKIFVLNFITSYLPIMLTAFVYVPVSASSASLIHLSTYDSNITTTSSRASSCHTWTSSA